MPKVLSLDFQYEHDYDLIGIATTLEDYRLSYLLNKNLNICLKREIKDIDFKNENCSFSLFSYDCKKTFSSRALISNKFIYVSKNLEKNKLFDEESNLSYLISEKKEFDYFIKIVGDHSLISIKFLKDTIKIIRGIISVHSVDPETLKSKEYLIF
jgi:hypothetical protein